MELNDGFISKEHRELLKAVTESADPSSISPLEVTSPRSPRSPRSPKSPTTPRGKQSPNKGSTVKHSRHSHSGKDGRPKKGMELFFLGLFLNNHIY